MIGQAKASTSSLRARRAVSAILATTAAVVVPKCPLCIAAWLSFLGLGSAFALPLASVLRPLLALSGVAILLMLIVSERRARRAAISASEQSAKERSSRVNSCCR